jgi:hypothetical protein
LSGYQFQRIVLVSRSKPQCKHQKKKTLQLFEDCSLSESKWKEPNKCMNPTAASRPRVMLVLNKAAYAAAGGVRPQALTDLLVKIEADCCTISSLEEAALKRGILYLSGPSSGAGPPPTGARHAKAKNPREDGERPSSPQRSQGNW